MAPDVQTAPGVRPGRWWVKLLLGAVCGVLVAMWVYAFFFASKQSVSRLDDRGWAGRAEAICRDANERRAQLADPRRIEDAGPDALAQRADIIDEATAIVEQMLDDLVSVAPTGPQDAALLERWEGFYRQLVEDRRAYTVLLREGRNDPFRETAEDGAPISEWINDFVVANEMTACQAPIDLSV